MGVSKEQLDEAVSAAMPTVSLTSGEDGESKQSDIPDCDESEALLSRITVEQALEKLDFEEKKIINLRYFKCLTQNETAKLLHMTQVQISRKEKRILLKMKGIIGNVS